MIVFASRFPSIRRRVSAKSLFLFLLVLSCLGLISCASAAFSGGGQRVQVVFSVSSQSLQVTQSANFTVTVRNDSSNKGVTWSVSGAGCTSNSCGTLTNVTPTSASYTAPGSAPSPPTVSLQATSVADPTASGSVTITISTAPPISVSVTPLFTAVQVSGTTSFTATVQNDSQNRGVSWLLSGAGCSGATCGTLSASSSASGAAITYMAPASAPAPVTVTLNATSVTDGTKSAAATITVAAAPVIVVTVSPATDNVQARIGAQNFSATVFNDPLNKGVNWSLSGAGCSGTTCGALSASSSASGAVVTYTAPASVPTPALVTLTAESVADSTKLGSAAITITAPVAVSVSPTTLSVQVSQTQSFAAAVANDSQNQGVTWSLSGAGCSGALCGTLSAASSASGVAITYTAPASVPAPASVTLKATSASDAGASSSATITITALPPISVVVTPPSTTVQVSQMAGFTASLQNDSSNKGVVWSLISAGCSGAACGTLTNVTATSATYNAPSSVPVPATVTLTATSVADNTKSATAAITITTAPPPISVSVAPLSTSVQGSQSAGFTATVQNDSQNKGVTWSLSGAGCSSNTCGTLSAGSSGSGVAITYTAPTSVPTPAAVTLTASSVTDGTKTAAATITVTAAPVIVVAVSPTSANVQAGIGTQNFTATVANDTQNKGVTWALSGSGCSGAACGMLSATSSASGAVITYTAPSGVPTSAAVTLTATSVSDSTRFGSATITLTAPVSVSVSPATATVQVSQTQSFAAAVANDSQNKGVTWSLSGTGCSGGTCGALSAGSSASGVAITYTAPASVPAPATVTLTAASVADGTKTAVATITVSAAPAIVVAVAPPAANVQAGIGTQTFTATVTNDTQNKGVDWTLSGVGCVGNACGTLSAASSASGVAIIYTAPAALPTPAAVTLTATSVTSNTKSFAATITVTAPVAVSVSPTTASVEVSKTQSFAATVSNDSQNKGVSWALSGPGCSGATCGTLSASSSASGVMITYTAPAGVPAPATATLTATSVTDATKSSSATITLTPAPMISVAVAPATANVQVGMGTQSFTATVTNDPQNRGVSWTLAGGGCSGATCGSLSSVTATTVTYNAPASLPSPATVTLMGTSVADNTKSAAATITITATPPPVATPTLVQMSACSIALNPDLSAQTQINYTCPLPNGTLTGNTVIFAVKFAPTGTVTEVVSDENGDTFTEEQSTTDSTNAVQTVLFCGQPTTASHKFTVTFTGTAKNTLAQTFEFNNITNCTKETSNGNVGAASTSLTPGSITPQTTGDFLFQFSSLTTQLTAASWAAGSQSNITWALASSDINNGSAAQWGQYNSTAPIGPTMTQSTSLPYVSVAVALKTSAIGSARPGGGIYVVGVHHNNYRNSSPTTIKAQVPVMGNLIAVQYGAISTYNVNSITDGTNTYTQIGTAAANNSSCQNFYAQNVTPAASYTLSMTMTEGGRTADNATALIFDIANADTSAPLDSTLGHKTTTGTQATGGAGGPLTFWTDLTPTSTNEVILVHGGEANDSATGVTQPSGAVFLSSYWNTAINPTMADENDFHAVFYNGASTVAETWTMTHDTINTPGIGTWAACGVAFKGPSSVPAPAAVTPTTSVAGGTKSVVAALPKLTISPRRGSTTPRQVLQFQTNLSTSGVTWSVDGVTGGDSTVGNISSTGLFTSGISVGTHNITVTVNGDASNNANSVIAVTDYAGTLTHQNDNARTGRNVQEYALTPSTVNSTQFAKLFTQAIDGWAYAQPLWVPDLAISGGTHNVVFVATMNNTVYAFDADAIEAPLWRKNLTPAGESTASPAQVKDTNILVNIGIIGTPAIDSSTGTLYVVAKTCDAAFCGSASDTNFHQRLHALDITTGNEKPNSPVEIAASVPGGGIGQIAFSPFHHMQRPGLLVSNGVVYVGLGSHDDNEPYHGWVLGYNATTLQQTMAYCTTPDGSAGSIWMSGAGLSADSAGSIYFITANGTFNADLGGHDYSDSIVKLSPSGTVLDYFTPNNQADLSAGDVELGSAGAMVLPDQAGAHRHEVLGGGKGGIWYLVDRDNMGHFHAVDNRQIVQSVTVNVTGGGVFSGMFDSPAYWNGNVYVSANDDALKAYRLSSGLLSFSPASTSSVGNFNFPAPPPAVSASGSTNGIVWVMSSAGSVLHAFDALNLGIELYNSGQATGNRDQTGYGVKFSVPTIANGKVYVGTQTELDVFGLLP
jgi:hypothetical protein